MAGSIKGITIEIDGNTSKLTQALKQPTTESRSLKSSLNYVNQALKFDTSNVDLLRNKQTLVAKSITSTKNEIDLLKTAQQQYIDSGGDLDGEEYINLQSKIALAEGQLKELEGQQRYTSAEVQSFGVKIGETGEKLTNAGTKMLGVTAAVGGLATAAVTTAANFESSMSQVQATMGITKDATSELNGETVNTMDALGDLAKEMGSTTKFSAVECADALNYLALAGYNTQEIYDSLPTVLNLAAAGNMDLATASDMVTDAMSALGLETSDAETMVDQMAKTASSSNTSVEQLGNAFLTVGGTAKTLVGGTTELSTALGILADNGIKGSEGGTQLRNIILSLTAPTSTAAKKLDALGVSVYDAEGNMRPLNETLEDFNNALATASDEERQNAIATVFNRADLKGVNALLANVTDGFSGANEALENCGVQWDKYSEKAWAANGTVEGVVGDIVYNLGVAGTSMEEIQDYLVNEYEIDADDALVMIQAVSDSVDDQGSRWDELTLAIDDSTGAAQQMADTQLDNFEGQLTLLQSALEGLATSFGEILLPMVKSVVDKIQGFVDWLNSLSDTSKQIITVIALVVAAIGPVLIIVGKLCTSISSIIDLVGKSQKVVSMLSSGFSGLSSAIGFLTSPIGLVIVAITALVAGIIYLWNTNEDFRNKVIEIWTAISEFCTNLWNTLCETLTEIWTTICETCSSVWEGISEFFSGLWESISEIFTTAWETITNIIQVAILLITEIFETLIEIWLLPWTFIWENFGEQLTQAWESFKQLISDALTAISETITMVWEAIWSWLGPFLETVRAGIETAWNAIQTGIQTAMTVIQTIITTVWNAISTAVTTVVNAIKSVITTVWNAISTAVTTVVNAIKSVITTVWNAISSTVTTVMNTIKNTFTTIWDSIKTKVTTAVDGIKSAISTGLEAAKSAVTAPLDAIKSKFTEIWDNCKSTVSGAIETIKSVMNFSWSLPHLNLPHFSISGSFSLNPPSVPHFSVSWYRKAMEGMILDNATIFGMANGKLLGGGESGEEAVVGTQSLKEMIYGSMESALISALETYSTAGYYYEPQPAVAIDYDQMAVAVKSAMADMVFDGTVNIDGKTAGTALAPFVDKALTKIANRR